MTKPRVAFFDFASCEGCQLQVVNLEEQILDVLNLVDIVEFREAMKESSEEYDIAIIEGSITRPMDIERIKKIRERAKILIALGACAHLGGVQRMGNKWTPEQNKEVVYARHKGSDTTKGDSNPFFAQPRHRAVEELVKVDVTIPGCPIDTNEFAKVLVALLTGKKPPIPDYPVCVECKKNENICLFTIGQFCMGPVARAGCGAICPTHGNECEACRGYVDHPHTQAQSDVLMKYGLTADEIMNRKTMFTTRYVEEGKQ
jgi:coenzyme F420-reducing hydrogenase gamma subunit